MNSFPSRETTQNKMATIAEADRPSANVEKPTPYTYDFGHLSTVDPNPLPPASQLLAQSLPARNEALKAIARDGAQSLLRTLLTSSSINIVSNSDSLLMNLPPCEESDRTPRWKPLPKPKEPTKWEQFARKKGIGKFGGNLKGGAALEDRRKNAVFNEATGEWEKKWGYKGKKDGVQSDWLVELDDNQVKTEKGLTDGKTIRNEGKREKMERMRRQERKERSNSKRSGKGKS